MGNALLGIFFVAIEVMMIDEAQSNYAKNAWQVFAVELFITLFILIIIIVYIPLSAGSISHENKQIYTISFITFVPIMTIAGIYRTVSSSSSGYDLMNMLIIILPLFGIYQATLNYVRRKSDNLYRAYLTITGFGFAFPVTISYTLYYINYLSITSVPVMAGIILIMYINVNFNIILECSPLLSLSF